jgi:hypothetical protein
VNNRQKRRAEIARFRRAGVLVTWLIDANDPSLHEVPPLLARAAHLWCEDLPAATASLHLLSIAHLGPTGGGRTVVEQATKCD